MTIVISKLFLLEKLNELIEDATILSKLIYEFDEIILIEEDVKYDNNYYQELIVSIQSHLESVMNEFESYQVEKIRSLCYLIENDILEEEFIFTAISYDRIRDLFIKLKKNIITMDIFSTQINKNYLDDAKLDIDKVIKIYEDGVFYKFWNISY